MSKPGSWRSRSWRLLTLSRPSASSEVASATSAVTRPRSRRWRGAPPEPRAASLSEAWRSGLEAWSAGISPNRIAVARVTPAA